MPSPFDQDSQPDPQPASEWPTQPHWPTPPASASSATPPPPPSAPPPPAGASPWQPAPATPPVWQARPAGPPTGPPPGSRPVAPSQPPSPGGWRSSGSKIGLAVAVVVALLVGATAGGVASRAILTTSSESASTATPPSTGSTSPTVPATPDQGSSGGTSSGSSGSGSGSTSGSSGQMASWGDVVDAVTVGVVNIESRMSGGVGAGTGMVLTSDGEVLTNNHVVEGASAIVVTVVTTGESYRASIVGRSPQEDVAVLQLQGASGLQTIPLGDSDAVAVGDQVAAIGNAGGKGGDPTVATGKVIALDRQITASDEDGRNAETLRGMIQVDANVVPGDSGGPLASTSGEVVGMNSAAAVAGGGSMRLRGSVTTTGEGYAIPINHALAVAEELKSSGQGASAADGSVGSGSGGFLGVQVTDGTDGGAEIVAVEQGSPAHDAGLAAGDTIVGVDRTQVLDPAALVEILSGHAPGDEVTITYLGTDGRTHQVTATLAGA